MTDRQQLYEGKAKVIFDGPEDGTLVQYFKDDATAFNAQKKDIITGKGILNNYISEHIMQAVEQIGIPTHFLERLNDREQLIRKLEIIPVEVVVRNFAAGSICPRLGIEEGLLYQARLWNSASRTTSWEIRSLLLNISSLLAGPALLSWISSV